MSLITSPRLHRLWNDAQIHPEWATTRLWEYIFNHVIFKDDKWVVSSQQPPTHQPGDLRRVDLIVEKMDSSATTIGTLLFLEVKRANAPPSVIQEVEYQAYTACCAYHVETGIKHIWTMTCVGSRARLWIFSERSLYLIPYIPSGQGLAERREYLEIYTHGREIANGLEYIKKHMSPPRELLNMPPTPRPANAMLPAGWHDTEVAHLDQVRHQDAVISPTLEDTMDFGEGPSTFASAQIPQEVDYGLGDEIPGWVTGEEFQEDSAGQLEAERYLEAGPSEVYHGKELQEEPAGLLEAEDYPEAGPSEVHQSGDGRQEVEVR
ncbi:hypothetical protein GE09DRAFT_662807 [Coniochaeta sp. 2T2.1]|nr:hypothetical protein GE09DRAFT_662807 [Coniochaeta sp. 2T2.1]